MEAKNICKIVGRLRVLRADFVGLVEMTEDFNSGQANVQLSIFREHLFTFLKQEGLDSWADQIGREDVTLERSA